jgi:hypothetical protein
MRRSKPGRRISQPVSGINVAVGLGGIAGDGVPVGTLLRVAAGVIVGAAGSSGRSQPMKAKLPKSKAVIRKHTLPKVFRKRMTWFAIQQTVFTDSS